MIIVGLVLIVIGGIMVAATRGEGGPRSISGGQAFAYTMLFTGVGVVIIGLRS